jgi:hypothetical protein
MIEKVDSRINFNPNTVPCSEMREVGNFHDLLAGKLDASKPVQRLIVEFLSQMIEKTLSEFDSEKEASLSVSPLSFDLPLFPSLRSSRLPDGSDLNRKEVLTRSQDHLDDEPFIKEAARRYEVDPALIRAMIKAESGGNPSAVSSAGAQGLMQLMPATAAELGIKDAFDPYQNIMAGTCYLRQLLDRYQGNVKLALAAYNWGKGNLERRPDAMPRETKNYIMKVENYYRSYLKSV